MSTYPNGQIPARLLIHMGGEHYATAGTKQKIEALIADIWENEGVRVWVTSGPNIYRDLQNQIETKNYFVSIGKGYMAAAPRTSSHGGEFNGKDALAADFSGYGTLGIAKWYAYLRKHGFEAGYFNGQNGRPNEPWHAIDWEPYRKVQAEPSSTPKEDDDMATIISYNDPDDTKRNGIWGAQGGNLLKFTKEQWAQARKRAPWASAPIVEFKPTGASNDPTPRAFDVYKSTLAAGGVSTAQVQQIADAVLAKIGAPAVTIDYQAIADAVNDEAALRMIS